MKKLVAGRGAFLRMLSGGVAVQAMISASNFVVGLLLVRRTADAQYGYYVLISTAVLLSTTLQGSFIQPPMIIRLTRSDLPARANLVGGLYRDQRRLTPFVVVLTLVLGVGLALAGRITPEIAAILVAGTVAVIAAMHREFFRMVLFAYRRSGDVLRSDVVYGVLLMSGALLATLTSIPAAVAALTLALSCIIGGLLLSRALWRHEPWNTHAPRGMLREIADQGSWSALGGGVHWLFSQGYNYAVAGILDVSAVAALAATRLLIMPISLLSTGIGSLMLPIASKWTHERSAYSVLRRLVLLAGAVAALACCYLVIVWFAHNWIFDSVLKKNFAQRDLLLKLWAAVALVTVFRDQLIYFMVSRARFRSMSSLTLVSAIVSLSISLVAMRSLGAVGALVGLLAGESVNVAGIIVLSIREARRSPRECTTQS
ncbi:MAG: capsular biosynthesis protein [Steroidobacteraceae bacterium]